MNGSINVFSQSYGSIRSDEGCFWGTREEEMTQWPCNSREPCISTLSLGYTLGYEIFIHQTGKPQGNEGSAYNSNFANKYKKNKRVKIL